MGNNLCGDELCSNHVTLGHYASIDTIKEYDVEYSQAWTMLYNIYESRCTLFLDKYYDIYDRVKVREVVLGLNDDVCFGGGMRVWIRKSSKTIPNNILRFTYDCDPSFDDFMSFKFNETFNPDQGLVERLFFCYERAGKGGLVVIEVKRKSREDKNIYGITVAHYYAIRRGYIFDQNQIDIGLSMIVNFHVSNGSLNYTVNGPNRHPSSALFYMFEQVYKSGIWTPTSCPHCADKAKEHSTDNMPKDNINNNIATNVNWLQSAMSTHIQLAKSTQLGKSGGTTSMVNSTNQSQPSGSSSSQSPIILRSPNFQPSAVHHGPKEDKRLELIDNKDIIGNGNGNRIQGDQKFKFSIPIKFMKKS